MISDNIFLNEDESQSVRATKYTDVILICFMVVFLSIVAILFTCFAYCLYSDLLF